MASVDRAIVVVSVPLAAVEPVDGPALHGALQELLAEDGRLAVSDESETGGWRLAGVSERHLGAAVDRLVLRFGARIAVGTPQVAYRETIQAEAWTEYTHKKLREDGSEYARITLAVAPAFDYLAQPGIAFTCDLAIADVFRDGVERGIKAIEQEGIVAGFPVVGVSAKVTDASWHEVDSTPLAFELAARAGLREALRAAAAVLLEPVLRLTLVLPAAFAADAVGDLIVRRGMVEERLIRGDEASIVAAVPVANLFGYDNSLNLLSRRQGRYETSFLAYQPVPRGDDDFPMAMAMRG
jgi:elongation factor G